MNNSELYNERCPTCGQGISKPRTTGYRSQNSRIWGDCTAIAEQLNERNNKKVWTKNMVYDLLKRYAVAEGVYPGIKYTFGKLTLIEPLSQSLVTKKEAKGLCDIINRFADENEMWLWEYTQDELKYKSIGGRSLEEMNGKYPGLNKYMEMWNA